MPLARGSQVIEIPDDGPIVGPVIPEIGTYEPTWIAPDGTEIPLNPPAGAHYFSLKQVAGLGVVPVDIVSTPSPTGGTVVDYVRTKERTIQWPLRIRGRTHLEFLATWRFLLEKFAQTRRLGPGRLRLSRPDGSPPREILAYYQTGLEQNGNGDGAWTTDSPVIGLYCPEGFWRSAEAVRYEWRQETNSDFLTPYPNVSSGRQIDTAVIRNDGHDDAWLDWAIRGPMTSLTAKNVARNETFVLTYTLGVGQTMTMSTDPITVRGPAGQNATSALNLRSGGIPWRVDAESSTAIQFTVAGAAGETAVGADNGTMVAASFTPLFETA